MDQSILTSPPRTPAARVRSVFSWLAGIVCFGFLLSVIVLIAHQIIVPPAAPRVDQHNQDRKSTRLNSSHT